MVFVRQLLIVEREVVVQKIRIIGSASNAVLASDV